MLLARQTSITVYMQRSLCYDSRIRSNPESAILSLAATLKTTLHAGNGADAGTCDLPEGSDGKAEVQSRKRALEEIRRMRNNRKKRKRHLRKASMEKLDFKRTKS